MATHKKSPLFIKVTVSDNRIICINPSQLSSFDITKNAKCVRPKPGLVGKPKSEEDVEHYTADVIQFFFPVGSTLRFEVGKEITEADFNYITAALNEWVYLIRPEFDAIQQAKAQEQMDKFTNDTK